VKQTISDLAIEATNSSFGALFVVGDGSVFDHLELIATGSTTLALRPGVNFTLTDSLLRGGLFVQGVADGTVQLRNDTIVTSGTGSTAVSVFVVMEGKTVTINATNVIADAETDASAGATENALGVINYDHSNLDTMNGPVTSTSGQAAPPLFVDAATGDYREAAGSPTIDAGVNDPANGETDLAGIQRTLPASVVCGGPSPPALTDIGAFEFVPAAPACVAQRKKLHTKITKAKIRGRRATFRFTGSGAANLRFSCRLDRKPWRRCHSPKTYRNLKPGQHTFRVRAIDTSGPFDSNPVKRKFIVKRPAARRH
jgi:hypothetical protein